MTHIWHRITDDGQHRISVYSVGVDCDAMEFVFTDEGLIIDSVTGGMVNATASETYEEIEDRLK